MCGRLVGGFAIADRRECTVILPLPVTPFEYYYLSDDRPQYPTVFPVRLELNGSLDPKLLPRALEWCVVRHPMLAARLDTSQGKWPCWVMGETPHIETSPSPASDSTVDARECAFRLWCDVAADRTTLHFLFHHACVDGLAGLQVAEDLLIAYDHLYNDRSGEPPWRALDVERLARRAEYGLADYKPKLIDLVNTVRFWSPLLLQRAQAVASPHAQIISSPPKVFSYAEQWLTAAESEQLIERAKSQGVTVNDLLLRELFLVLHHWNQQHESRSRPIRILVPTNLRVPEDVAMPAANVLSFVFLTRSQGDLRDADKLLNSIREETAAIKKWRLGLYFVGGLGIATRLPGLVAWFLRRRWPFATAVFTNLGPVFSRAPGSLTNGKICCGTGTLERVSGTAPLRPDTRLAVTALTYAGRLGIFVKCDPQWFTEEEQSQLLQMFVARIAASAV